MSQHHNVTAGIDIGDRYSHLCLLDTDSGEVIEAGRIPTNTKAFERRFSDAEPMHIAIETGTHSPWVSRLLEECGHEVLVANARKVRLIYGEGRKNDKLDAEKLARLARVDSKLLALVKYRGERSQAHLAPALGPVLKTIATLTERIRGYDRNLEGAAEQVYPETKLLRQAHGVGVLTALTFVLTLEDPSRFAKSREVGAYLGLVPASDQSGGSDPEKHISKHGNKMMRKPLVSSAHYILGPFGEDCDLRRYGEKLASRGGKNAKKRAVAGKLSVLLHRLWVSGEVYEPLYNASRRESQAA